jgi:hypothetical protein
MTLPFGAAITGFRISFDEDVFASFKVRLSTSWDRSILQPPDAMKGLWTRVTAILSVLEHPRALKQFMFSSFSYNHEI